MSTNGAINTRSAFFRSLGTNGRSCATCHVAGQAFGLSAAGAQARFVATHGRDPLFAPVDGANCPTGAQSRNHSVGLVAAAVVVAAAAVLVPNPPPGNSNDCCADQNYKARMALQDQSRCYRVSSSGLDSNLYGC